MTNHISKKESNSNKPAYVYLYYVGKHTNIKFKIFDQHLIKFGKTSDCVLKRGKAHKETYNVAVLLCKRQVNLSQLTAAEKAIKEAFIKNKLYLSRHPKINSVRRKELIRMKHCTLKQIFKIFTKATNKYANNNSLEIKHTSIEHLLVKNSRIEYIAELEETTTIQKYESIQQDIELEQMPMEIEISDPYSHYESMDLDS